VGVAGEGGLLGGAGDGGRGASGEGVVFVEDVDGVVFLL